MNIGIYARKSIFSDKSDSIDTQIGMCKEYSNSHYPDANIFIYSDEGYTGANTERPGYNSLMNDILNNRLDVLICYKIDRISRNVLDFSKTFNELQNCKVEFVSIKEQIDTSTPLGRAMMYICSVFAQMERETIAERVADNMIALAKDGKWAGGVAPLGYTIVKRELNGKKHSVLEIDNENADYVNMLFDKFLNAPSLMNLETTFKKNNIRTKSNNFFSSSQIHRILSTPFYAPNTSKIYDYFAQKGCIMACEREKFDGKHGVMVYGRTSGGKKKKHTLNPPEKWTVCVGLHESIMNDEKWLMVQERFGKNKIDKTRKYEIGILKGILRCKCGCLMRTKYKHDKEYDIVYQHYFCNKRIREGKDSCDTPMINLVSVDATFMEFLSQLSLDKNLLKTYMDKSNENAKQDIKTEKDIKKEIANINKKITNLTTALQDSYGSAASKYIIKEIDQLDSILIGLNFELREVKLIEEMNKSLNYDVDIIYNEICQLVKNYNELSYSEINGLLSKIIKSCVWKDGNMKVVF